MSALIKLKVARLDNNPDSIKLGLRQVEKLMQFLDDCHIDQDPALFHHASLFQFELFCRQGSFEDAKDLLQNMNAVTVKVWAAYIGVFEHVIAPNSLKAAALQVCS